MGIHNKLKGFLAGLALIVSCSTNNSLPPQFISKLEQSAQNFRHFSYPYEMSTFYDKEQKIEYHFEKQEDKGNIGIHLLVTETKGVVRCYHAVMDYNQGKITTIKKTKEWKK